MFVDRMSEKIWCVNILLLEEWVLKSGEIYMIGKKNITIQSVAIVFFWVVNGAPVNIDVSLISF
jgi:hypothetical protein